MCLLISYKLNFALKNHQAAIINPLIDMSLVCVDCTPQNVSAIHIDIQHYHAISNVKVVICSVKAWK